MHIPCIVIVKLIEANRTIWSFVAAEEVFLQSSEILRCKLPTSGGGKRIMLYKWASKEWF
jgi:hypothetical protein